MNSQFSDTEGVGAVSAIDSDIRSPRTQTSLHSLTI